MGRLGLDSSSSGQGPVAVSFEHSNETSGFIKSRKYLISWAIISFPEGICFIWLVMLQCFVSLTQKEVQILHNHILVLYPTKHQ
jgi:hypothetical protein